MATQVVLMGLGAIGRLIARAALSKPELEIIAAIDLDSRRVGRKLSDIVDAPAPDVTITADAAAALKQAQRGVLLHATGSRLDQVEGELAAEQRRNAELVATLTAALTKAEARADRLEAALAEARRPWLAKVLEGLRRKG